MTNFQFLESDKHSIVAAIRRAELLTSGEIKVHIEDKCKFPNPMKRAMEVFDSLELDKTIEQNCVLLYIAILDRKFAIIGDKGIDKAVPNNFWDAVALHLRNYFKEGKYVEGLIDGIEMTGKMLQKYFPYDKHDVNEISDEISFG